MKKIKSFISEFAKIYLNNRLSVSAAGLSYYLTMTLFPIVICIYTMLGNNYERAMDVLDLLARVFPEKTLSIAEDFLEYVSENYSVLMMFLALSVILITSSAAFRLIDGTIGQMQGGRRYEGYGFFVFSIVLSLAFLAIIYLGIAAIFFSENLIMYVNVHLPQINLDQSWVYLKYPVLFAVFFLVIVLIFEVCKRREDNYKTYPGALISTVGLEIVSVFFSLIISKSVKYQVVYGWLGSVIVLMFWLYSCTLVIFCGAAANVAIRNIREKNQPEDKLGEVTKD